MKPRLLCRIVAVLLIVWFRGSFCGAADLLVLTNDKALEKYPNVHTAADYYGLHVATPGIDNKSEIQRAIERLADPNVLGVVIPADDLAKFSRSSVLTALHHRAVPVPLYINGITSQTDSDLLRTWSREAIRDCGAPPTGDQPASFLVGNTTALLHEIAGLMIPSLTSPACIFRLDNAQSETLLAYGNANSPTFLRVHDGSQEIFFEALGKEKLTDSTSPKEFFQRFSQAIPAMVFVRYAAGESGWHSPAHYANFTVDDVWLTQPYGHLDFRSLLEEMEKHNFHTTLAFIPWNFDRSEPAAIALVRDHPDRYSICIHGDNHDHMEFIRQVGDNEFAPLSDADQAARLKQAIARMERFQSLTGIPYGRYMIWPHEIFSTVTLKFLKRYNYVGMANESLSPVGSKPLEDDKSFLTATTISFENFPGTRRYAVENGGAPEYLIALAAFLEHPLLFYAHHVYFAGGAGAFDTTADFVNRIDSKVNWSGLTDIGQHLYKIRRRADHDLDVWAMTADFILRNDSGHDETYHIVKDENFADPIRQMSASGRPISYVRQGDQLTFTLDVPAGEERHVQIEYQNDLNLAEIDLSKPDWRINALRWSSDFRDLVLGRYAVGGKLVEFYYDRLNKGHRTFYASLAGVVVLGVLLLVLAFRLWQTHRKRSAARTV